MFERASEMVNEGVAVGVFPSAALAIGVRDKVLLSRSWGNACIDPPMPANTGTLYDLASLTKIVGTTMTALKMIEEGKICLKDTLSTFFDVPADKETINIRHLMTHTGGFTDHFRIEHYTSDPGEVIRVILEYPLAYETGRETLYSCIGYILLGKILEKIGGAPLDKLAQQYVFDPLKLSRTMYLPSPGNVASTEFDEATGKYLHAVVHDENARFLNGISGNAGIFSDIGDMTRFTSMLACGGTLDGEIYINRATLDAAIRNYTPNFCQNRGLGFKLHGGESEFMGDLFSQRSFGHTGFTGTSLSIDPDNGLFVVLLTNRVHPTRNNIGSVRFRNLLHNCIAAEYARLGA